MRWLGVFILSFLLIACGSEESEEPEIEIAVNAHLNETPEPIEELTEKVIPEKPTIDAPITKRTFTVNFEEITELDYDLDGKTDYTFSITEVVPKRDRITLVIQRDAAPLIWKISESKVVRVEDDISAYVSDIDIANIPEVTASARITVGEFDKNNLRIFDDKFETVVVDDVSFDVSFTDFRERRNAKYVTVKLRDYDIEENIKEGITTKVGPLDFKAITINLDEEEVVAIVSIADSQESNDIYNISTNTPLVLYGEIYKVSISDVIVNTDGDSLFVFDLEIENPDGRKETETFQIDETIEMHDFEVTPKELSYKSESNTAWLLVEII